MLQQKLFSFVCLFSLLVPFSATANIPQFEIAQGDGEPTEVSVQEQLDAAKKLADDEEDVATVTASGDFLVPTYLLKTVDDPQDNPSIEYDEQMEHHVEEVLNEDGKIIAVHEKTEYDLPVVKISQTELIPVKEQTEVEKKLTGSTKQTREIYNKIKKIKSPDTVSEKDVLSNIQVSSSVEHIQKTDVKPVSKPTPVVEQTVIEKPIKKQTVSISADDEINSILSGDIPADQPKEGKRKPLLLPLKGTKTVETKSTHEEPIPAPTRKTYSSIYADKVLEAAQTNQNLPLIMPLDLKVTFYPNSADFSGQTIKWLKAFSLRALQDPRYVIEIRLSTTNSQLQQKRLLLVQKILTNAGLSSHQLVVDYVNRPADSLILRMVKKETHLDIPATDKKGKKIINW